jgi:hypothetical protein
MVDGSALLTSATGGRLFKGIELFAASLRYTEKLYTSLTPAELEQHMRVKRAVTHKLLGLLKFLLERYSGIALPDSLLAEPFFRFLFGCLLQPTVRLCYFAV